MSCHTRSALVLALLAASPMTSVSAADRWEWVVAPYLWAPSVTTDLRQDLPPVGSETSFSDLVDKLDMAFQGHVEGQGDRFGAFGDVTYLGLSDEHDYGGSAVSTRTSLDATMVELAGVWNVDPERYEGLDVFVGVRHTMADVDVRFIPQNPALPVVKAGIDESYTDAMVGARYTAPLTVTWGASVRADGSWGGTEGTFNVSALLTRKFSRGSMVFGYRYLQTELEEAGQDIEITMAGPIVSFAFGL